MDEQLFIKKIIEQLEGYQGAEITMNTAFRSLDVWDSLTGVAVQIMISDDFESTIPDSEFVTAKTVQDLFELAQKHKK